MINVDELREVANCIIALNELHARMRNGELTYKGVMTDLGKLNTRFDNAMEELADKFEGKR